MRRPAAPFATRPSPMKIVTYNIQYGRGRDDRIDLDRTAAAIAGADIAGLQEVDRFAPRSDFLDQPAELGSRLPNHAWVFGPTVDIVDPRTPVSGRRRQFGIMILSRWPILTSRTLLYWPKIGGGNHLSLQLGVIEAIVAAPAGPLRVYCTHLHHLSPLLRARQIEQLLAIVRTAPQEGTVVSGAPPDGEWYEGEVGPKMPAEAVLLGDFNLTPDSENYTQIVGPPVPHDRAANGLGPAGHPRLIAADGFVDAWVAAGHGERDGVTVPEPRGNPTPCRVDYGFVSAALAARVRRAWIDGDTPASDHQPAWFELDG